MPPVDTRVPLYVGIATPATAVVTNDSNVSVLYQVETNGGSTISQAVFDGAIGPANTLTVNAPTFFLATGQGAQVEIDYVVASSDFAEGLVQSDGTLISADDVATLTGNVADDIEAIGGGTGALISVAQEQVVALGTVTGSVQLNLATATESLFRGGSASGNVSLTVINAEVGNSFAVLISMNGHTFTPPTGTSWENNTAPTPSGSQDAFTFLVDAVSSGVPTRLLGRYSLGYP